MELKDTIELMNSSDYKERFIAEYKQTEIRYEKLKDMLAKHEKGELDLVTAQKQAETNKAIAQGEADVAIIEAKAVAEENRLLSESITEELIRMKEAEARLKHGWVEIQGASTVIKD